jgi:hypothetical protein
VVKSIPGREGAIVAVARLSSTTKEFLGCVSLNPLGPDSNQYPIVPS